MVSYLVASSRPFTHGCKFETPIISIRIIVDYVAQMHFTTFHHQFRMVFIFPGLKFSRFWEVLTISFIVVTVQIRLRNIAQYSSQL